MKIIGIHLTTRQWAAIAAIAATVALAALWSQINRAPVQAAPTGTAPMAAATEPTPWLRPYGELPVNSWEQTQSTSGNASALDASTGLDLFVKTVFVLGLLFVSLRGLKLWTERQRLGAPATNAISVMETTYLAPNRALHVVRVGGRLLLLGATTSSIALLTELDADPDAATPEPDPADLASALAANRQQQGAAFLDALRGAVGSQRQPSEEPASLAPVEQLRQRMGQLRERYQTNARV